MTTTTLQFRIYRYNPDKDAAPYMQDIAIEADETDRKLLDALVKLKVKDDTLSFRRSCREGVCGSDAMNINGKNGLACLTVLKDLKQPIELRPLPGLPIIRDLIVDMTQFFKQYHSIKPYVQTTHRRPSASVCNRPKTVKSWMVCTSAFCVRAVRHRARLSGGTQTNSSAQLVCWLPIALLLILATWQLTNVWTT